MEFERLFVPAFSAVTQVVVIVVLIVASWRAANGRLRRNPWTGIRTGATMRSDQAWVAGHRAALRLTPLYLLVLAGTLTVLFVAVFTASTDVVVLIGVGGFFSVVPLALYTAFIASKAARSADDTPAIGSGGEDPDITMHTDQTPNARYGRIVIRFYVAFHGLLLTSLCAGLWFLAVRSNSDGIPPNTRLGFRTQHTLASAHGWYAAQRVGFHIAAIADTIVTAAVFTIIAVAYIRRLNPMWIFVAPIVGGLAIAACMVIAGNYADHAATTVSAIRQLPVLLM